MVVPAQASNPSTSGHIQGNVDLAPGVAMAPGVLLGAAPGCRLVISSGVCLGADAVVQARQGDLVLEIGVSLGSGVLVVGHGSIGQHTCVGANSTIINPTLGPSQVVAPGSLVGDPSQPSSTPAAVGPPPANGSGDGYTQRVGYNVQTGSTQGENALNGSVSKGSSLNGSSLSGSSLSGSSLNGGAPVSNPPNGSSPSGSSLNGSSVSGKTQVNRLLSTLFPHRQALNGATPEDRP